MGELRLAIVGVGNCATSLIQGVEYYKDADPEGTVPGLMHVLFGDYHVNDVQFVAAFDVDAKKVGFDLSEATQASENNTIKIADVPPTGVIVQRGPRWTAWASTTARPSRRPRATGWTSSRCSGTRSRRARVLPARGLGAGGQVLRAVRDRRGRRVRQRAAGLHRLRPGLGEEFADAGLPVIVATSSRRSAPPSPTG